MKKSGTYIKNPQYKRIISKEDSKLVLRLLKKLEGETEAEHFCLPVDHEGKEIL
jgi:hypothetical protein